MLHQIIIGFAHFFWNVALIHSLSELIRLDHPVDTTNALPSMDLHLECISDILPSLGHLSNLLRKGVKSDSLQEQLSIRVLGPIPTLLLHPLESLGLVHHLKELLQKALLSGLLLLSTDGPIASCDTGLDDIIEPTGACPGSNPLFPRDRLPRLCGFADRTVEGVVLQDACQEADLDIDRERTLGRASSGLDPEGACWLIRLLLLDRRLLWWLMMMMMLLLVLLLMVMMMIGLLRVI